MIDTLKPLLDGRVVWDLGCGSGDKITTLVACGAAEIVAIDKEPEPKEFKKLRKHLQGIGRCHTITYRQELFQEMQIPAKGLDVAFLSWPTNTRLPIALIDLLEHAKMVVYLGKNDGYSTSCGSKALFEHLIGRELLGHVEAARNDLIVVGKTLPFGRRFPTLEERHGILGGI